MYKKLFFAAAVAATFAGCTKNEVNPVETPDLEITYQAIVNPKTKAGEPKFNEGHVFQSYAYLLPSEKTWENNAADATLFIKAATISYNGTAWKDADNSYYWPKNGKLTFLSWTLDKNSLDLPEGASAKCDQTNGVQITGFNLSDTSQDNLMVADVAADKTANENEYNYTGVPTLFRHKLCKVKCVVAAGANNPEGTTISVESLTFGNIAQKGDYVQFPVDPDKEWKNLTGRTPVGFDVPSTGIVKEGSVESNVLFFIPQTFEDTQLVTITYTVTDNAGIATPYTQTIALNNTAIFGTTGWEMNKSYTLTITIGLEEILWDPAEEPWVDENKVWNVD